MDSLRRRHEMMVARQLLDQFDRLAERFKRLDMEVPPEGIDGLEVLIGNIQAMDPVWAGYLRQVYAGYLKRGSGEQI